MSLYKYSLFKVNTFWAIVVTIVFTLLLTQVSFAQSSNVTVCPLGSRPQPCDYSHPQRAIDSVSNSSTIDIYAGNYGPYHPDAALISISNVDNLNIRAMELGVIFNGQGTNEILNIFDAHLITLQGVNFINGASNEISPLFISYSEVSFVDSNISSNSSETESVIYISPHSKVSFTRSKIKDNTGNGPSILSEGEVTTLRTLFQGNSYFDMRGVTTIQSSIFEDNKPDTLGCTVNLTGERNYAIQSTFNPSYETRRILCASNVPVLFLMNNLFIGHEERQYKKHKAVFLTNVNLQSSGYNAVTKGHADFAIGLPSDTRIVESVQVGIDDRPNPGSILCSAGLHVPPAVYYDGQVVNPNMVAIGALGCL